MSVQRELPRWDRVLTGLLILACVGLYLSGCAAQTQRQAAYNGAQAYILLLDLSAKAYGNCHATAQGADEEDDCYHAKESRHEAITKAKPYLMAAKSAAMVAPDQPADSNLAQARVILMQIQAALIGAATDAEVNQVGWLSE